MATWEYELIDPPTDQRARELWLQNAAAFIVFEDIRRYAMQRIDPTLGSDVRSAIQKGIDDAVYGLMMIIDGQTGEISNKNHAVSIDFIARLLGNQGPENSEILLEIDLREGDGMCMGYHGWLNGDYGEPPIAVPQITPDSQDG